jgi:hypothetical protein
MPDDPTGPADLPAVRTDSITRQIPDQPSPRTGVTGDDDLLTAFVLRMWRLVSGRFLPQNVWPDQLNEEELIGFWADDTEVTTTAPSGHVCVMLAFDIVGFTRPDRDEEVRIHLHKVLYEILREAFQTSGLPWDRCHHEDRGDGALVILPPGIFAHGIINPFPERLRSLIRRHNRMSCPAAQIQIRAAAHLGPVYRDDHGLVGDDINLLFRMLNAKPLRTALAGSGTELALAISAYMYDSFVRRHPALAGPAVFHPMNTKVKGTRVRARMHLPGVPPQLPWPGPGRCLAGFPRMRPSP